MKRILTFVKIGLVISLIITLLSGCGGSGSNAVSSSYPLESVTKNAGQESRVYRAANKTVPQVAQELTAQKKPDEISKEDTERMFLVYPDVWYHLQKDTQKPSDTLIEVDSKEFVKQNYNPSFLEGYILGSILSDLFGTYNHSYGYGTYRGYSTKDTYKPTVEYRAPTTQEKKSNPPITVSGSGSIIKRGNNSTNSGGGSGVGSGNSSNSNPKMNSPPKTKYGGSGSVRRRK